MKHHLLLIFILSFNFNVLSAQKTSDVYWKKLGIAYKYYDNADYSNAALAFDTVWMTQNEEVMANHRLHAAAANCMIDDEEKVRENLFKIIDVASKTDVKRVLVNYEIFNKYKETSWWKELDEKLNQRIQKLIFHHKNLRIFKKGRDFKYSAIRINNQGDTLANTFITIIPDGTGWGDEAADLQSQVIYKYEYTSNDSIEHYRELDSIVETNFWIHTDTTGIIENNKRVWMHPIRNNEFFKTEIAPFPSVYFPISDSLMQEVKVSTMIMKNWGTYSQTETKERYSYHGEINRNYNFRVNLKCHKFNGTGENSLHGMSYLEYYFHEDFGFVEMNYTTYDGDKILFKMVDIVESQ